MFGPNGPLPLHLSEYARDRLRNSDDPTFSEFLDIFHHRMLSLFYRAWANAQPTVNFDRPEQDRFSVYTGALFGLGMPSLRNRDEMPDLAKLHFAGRLSSQTRNAEGLVAMIRRFFKVPAVIEQFVGEWMKLPDDCRCRLGVSPETGTLGVNIAIGDHAWECQQKFRIILGPLNFKDYERMLPGRDSGKRLRAMVRNYVGDSMNWDVNLVLKKEKLPLLKLGEDDLLGWNTWLGNRTSDDDINDLVLEFM
jgi:type VI secretion system protein ImpH